MCRLPLEEDDEKHMRRLGLAVSAPLGVYFYHGTSAYGQWRTSLHTSKFKF